MNHGHGPAEFPGTISGLRSVKLLGHMRSKHAAILREQLDLNGYDAEYVSHTWLSDVHDGVAHADPADDSDTQNRRMDAAVVRRAANVLRRLKVGPRDIPATLDEIARQIEEM